MSSLALAQAEPAISASSGTKLNAGLAKIAIIDIRQRKTANPIRSDILEKLQPGDGKEKKMPTLLLYDEVGLKLFEAITFLDEVFVHWRVYFCLTHLIPRPIQYYPTNAEIEILQTWAWEMAKLIKRESIIVELGSGCCYQLSRNSDGVGYKINYFAI